MQYPSDWRVEGASNSSIVALFYSQGDNASKVTVQIENLGNSFTPDQYLNGVMRGDVANYKDFPDIKFTDSTTSNIVLAGHPGFFLNGTFRDPTSGVLDRFTNIGTIIADKAYSAIYYSPAQTYPDYRTAYGQMIGSFEVIPTESQPSNQTQPPTTNPNPSPTTSNPPTTTNGSIDSLFGLGIVIFLIVISFLIVIAWRLKHTHYFSESVKEKILEKQHHRCADCNKVLNVVDWHHRNGDRSDNRESNCEALCPNCHAIRTRRSAT